LARSAAAAATSLRRKAQLASRLGVRAGKKTAFYNAVEKAMAIYREVSTPKGHSDSPAQTARRFRSVGQAAVSGSPRRMTKALGGLTANQLKRLKDLAGASSGWSQDPTVGETAAAAVLGSGAPRSWPAKRRVRQGLPPPRTLAALPGGRPDREDLTVLVSFLAAALAGATGRTATRGSKNVGAAGTLIPSALELLVSEVQSALGESGQWDAVDRVRAHIAARNSKPARR
jgi:hypothetical protein